MSRVDGTRLPGKADNALVLRVDHLRAPTLSDPYPHTHSSAGCELNIGGCNLREGEAKRTPRLLRRWGSRGGGSRRRLDVSLALDIHPHPVTTRLYATVIIVYNRYFSPTDILLTAQHIAHRFQSSANPYSAANTQTHPIFGSLPNDNSSVGVGETAYIDLLCLVLPPGDRLIHGN